MKKFIIACTAVIIAVTCWMFVSDRIGSTLSFNMNKEVKTFTTVSDKEILVDTGNGMEEGKRQELLENMRNADIEMLKKKGRVGIVNACLRLKMVSENKVKIDLDGEEGVGTLITIWMPLEYM